MKPEPAFIQERTLARAVLRRLQRNRSASPAVGTRTFGLGLIGAGNVARWQHLPWLRRNPGRFRIAAVFDIDQSRAFDVAREFGAKVCASVEELAAESDVEAVLVCTPDPQHAAGALAAINAGKHALVEKPFCIDADEARSVWEAAQKAKNLIGLVNFSFRFRPDFLLARQIIAHGLLGEVYQLWGSVSQGRWFSESNQPSRERADATPWKLQEGVLLDLGPHVLDLARWWLGEISIVQAWTKHLAGTDGEASCGLNLTFESGAVAQLLTSRLATGSKEQTSLEITGAAGALRLREGGVELWTRDVPRWRRLMLPPVARGGLAAFHAAILGRSDAPTFWDGYKNNEALAAAAESAESGRIVALSLGEDTRKSAAEITPLWPESAPSGVSGFVEKIKRGIAAAL